MPWETFIINQNPASILKPGNYGTVATKAITDTAGGVELIAEDTTKKLRFANISVQSKVKADGSPITVFIGQGVVPTSASYSFKWLAGHEEKDLELNGQDLTAITETGQTINIQIQTADAVIVN